MRLARTYNESANEEIEAVASEAIEDVPVKIESAVIDECGKCSLKPRKSQRLCGSCIVYKK